MSLPVKIRPSEPKDHSLIIDSWAHIWCSKYPYKYGDERTTRNEIINQIKYIIGISEALVATDEQDDDVIFGYVVWQQKSRYSILHMVYVKKPFCGMELGSELVKEAIPNFGKFETVITQIPLSAPPGSSNYHAPGSHEPPFMEDILRKYNCVYDPFLISEGYYKDKYKENK
jgi:hypothetical protein